MVTEKTLAELIIEKLGPKEGQKAIDEIDGIKSVEDLASLLGKYKSEGKSPLIFVVWAVEF